MSCQINLNSYIASLQVANHNPLTSYVCWSHICDTAWMEHPTWHLNIVILSMAMPVPADVGLHDACSGRCGFKTRI
jgi:hypothetical protein